MDTNLLAGKSLEVWKKDYPLLNPIMKMEEVFWTKPDYGTKEGTTALTKGDIWDAAERMKRFASYFEKAFPETAENKGIIKSPLISIPVMQKWMEETYISLEE